MSLPERALRIWAAPKEPSELSKLVVQGYKLEAEGRRLAAERETCITEAEDGDWIHDVATWHYNVLYEARNAVETLFTEAETKEMEGLSRISDRIDAVTARIVEVAVWVGASRSAAITRYADYSDLEALLFRLRDYDSTQRKLTNRSGLWLLDRAMRPEDYTFSAFLNDYTSCFHQFLNWLNQRAGGLISVAPRVLAYPLSAPLAIEACSSWNAAIDKYYEWRLYADHDYRELAALIRGNAAEVRVGSAQGHASHIDFYPLMSRAEYYDNDEPVHKVFMRLCEAYGCTVATHEERVSTVVVVPRMAWSDFFQGVLPLVTSMDLRMGEPYVYWAYKFGEDLEKMEEQELEMEEMEYRLCLKAYSKFMREAR